MNHLYYRLLVVGLLIMGFSSYAFLTPPTISFAQPSQPFSTTAIIQPTIIDNPVTAIDAVGDIIIAWAQYDDSLTTSNVYAGRYNSTTSAWDIDPTTGNTYTLLSTLGNDNISANPQIAMHFLGNAFVSWFDNDGVYASQYILGTGWDASPTTLSNNITVGTVQAIRIAINSNSINPTDPTTGTAIVVWSNTTTVYANTYSVGVGWEGTPDAISTYTINQINPNIAFDGIGNAMAVWNDVTASKIITRYYDATTGWQSAAPCSGIFSPDSSCSPAIAATKTVGIAAPAGDFMCVFQGTSNTVLYSVLYDYNWQSVLIIQPAHPHSVYLYPSHSLYPSLNISFSITRTLSL